MCNYNSNDISNYKRHLNSKKHKRNENENKNENETKTNIKNGANNDAKYHQFYSTNCNVCTYCGSTFSRLDGLKRHQSKCSHKIISRNLETIKNQNEKLKLYEKMLDITTGEKDKNVSNFKYVSENYKGVPPLQRLSYDKVRENTIFLHIKDEDLKSKKTHDELSALEMIHCYRHGIFDYHIEKIIGKIYKDNIPVDKRQIWTTDHSRLKFMVSSVDANGKIYWKSDVSGQIILKKIIRPITKKIVKILTKYAKNHLTLKNCQPTHDAQQAMMKTREDINDMIVKIKDGKFDRKILRRIAPKFAVTSSEE